MPKSPYTELKLPPGTTQAPVVMMASGDGPDGVTSNTYLSLAADLATRGIGSFVFDFEGLGKTSGDARRLTLSRGISNFQEAAQILISDSRVDITRLGLFASSFGAAVALGAPATVNRFQTAVFKSPVASMSDAYLQNLTTEELADWQKTGFNRKFHRHFEAFEDAFSYSGYEAATRISTPSLIIHGAADSLVTPLQSQALSMALGRDVTPRPEIRLSLLPGVNHSFTPKAWAAARVQVVQWFAAALVPELEPAVSPAAPQHFGR